MFIYWEHKTKCYGMNVPASVHLICWKEPVLCPMGAQWLESIPGQRGKSSLSSTHVSINTWHEFKGGIGPHSISLINAFATRLNASMTRRRCANSVSSDVGASLLKSLVGERGRKPQVEGLPTRSCWQLDVLNVPHPIRIKHPPYVPQFAERWAARNPARKWFACRRRRRKNVRRRCQPQMRTDGLRVKVHGAFNCPMTIQMSLNLR